MLRDYEFPFSTLALCINILHVIILSQKPMRNTCISVILLGISINDMYTLSVPGLHKLDDVLFSPSCNLPDSATRVYLTYLSGAIRFATRRSATWLNLSMAVIRTIVVKKPTSSGMLFFTSPRLGIIVIIATELLSSSITISHTLRQQLVQNGAIVLNETCLEHGAGAIFPTFLLIPAPFFARDNNFLTRLMMAADATISRVIPGICLPIITYLLIKQLNKTRAGKTNLSKVELQKSARVTKLVISLTSMFMIVEFPLGLLYFAMGVNSDPSFAYYLSNTMDLFITLWDLNSASHFFICYAMSSQYRQTTRRLLNLYDVEVLKRVSKTPRSVTMT